MFKVMHQKKRQKTADSTDKNNSKMHKLTAMTPQKKGWRQSPHSNSPIIEIRIVNYISLNRI